MMNRQKIYNKVKTHLLTQNQHSRTDNLCAYRGEDNRMCAIGCLILDNLYDSRMEGKTVRQLYLSFRQQFDKTFGHILNSGDMDFLTGLQKVHDKHHPHEWGGALMKVACDYGLDP